MTNLSEHDVFIFITQLGIIIFAARILSEIARRLKQPILVGEIIAGILLGPLIFGKLFPHAREAIFPSHGPATYLLQSISWLCALFLLLITGLEIDFRASLQYGKRNILTSLFGFLFPFAGVYLLSSILPEHFYPQKINPVHVNLLIATALSVASVPVIGKILFDLKIFHSNVGLNIVTSSVLSDIWEWSTLLFVIALVTKGMASVFVALKPIFLMFLYLAAALTLGRVVIEKIFDWMGTEFKDTAAILAVLFALMLLNGAIAHLLGIHVLFGAFLTGLMVGESERITPFMRQSIQDFIFGVFAPIFFVLIGMQLQIARAADLAYIFLLMAVASVGKIGGAFLGALLSGIGRKNAFAVGCGLNAQGAMGIVVALIGLELSVFNDELFSAIVLICIVTSLTVGPSLKFAIKGIRRPIAKFLDTEHIFIDVPGKNKREIIKNMVQLIAQKKIIQDARLISSAIWQREESLSTAIGEGIALPHARIPDLRKPILCFFRLSEAVDFDSPDNIPVQLVFLELTDSNDEGMQLTLISQVSRLLASPQNRTKLLNSVRTEEIHHILAFDESV